ncbi:Ypk2p [Rhizophagus irregularis DAOM 197198w]|uniref:Ypk2p n=1 Tax=Rhizophagus irregularis (strain DAOM 197198w) TaxID=1432141 RepID=A0A015JR86_RHIIW|nr:Ypk2p [Rhizophagus irregularis DAOM 197198w]
MGEFKLSDVIIEQIKDFNHRNLTKEQKSLIDKLILNEELKKRYKENGLCNVCNRIKICIFWCNYCLIQQNFKNWTSGNNEVDEFIQKTQLKAKYCHQIMEWIEYDRFENVEYLAKGGFGTVFKAIWKDGPICNYYNHQWKRSNNEKIALKCLHNSRSMTAQFLKEKKFQSMHGIAYGLKDIHKKGLIHHDFHCGNILSDFIDSAYITDLGLCQPANVKTFQDSNKKIYGVLPYVAPEVLRGKEYTQASDIYGFGIITYEICTGLPPYYDVAHDEFLAMKICQGLRPKINYRIPQLLLDIINQCWDANPLNRPKVNELYDSLRNLYNYGSRKFNPAIVEQIKEVDKINEDSSYLSTSSPFLSTCTLSYMTHPQAIYTSKLLDFKNLPEPKNSNDNNDLLGNKYSGN